MRIPEPEVGLARSPGSASDERRRHDAAGGSRGRATAAIASADGYLCKLCQPDRQIEARVAGPAGITARHTAPS